MIEFIDKTSEQDGTYINRATMMAIQGFIENTIEILPDGSILETNADGHTLKTFKNDDGSITQIFSGNKIITKNIKNENGIIKEVIS